jgi:hypothetical protein
MAFQLSPGVLVQEQDASNVVPAVATTIGGFVGDFSWGPAREIVSIENENQLSARFGRPNDTTAQDFMTASSYLAYGSSLKVVREVGTAENATADGTGLLIRNDDEYENNYINGEGAVGMWVGRFPGALGNSLKVSMADLTTYTATSIASVTVDAGGSGYTTAPTVTFAAPVSGTNATGTAVLAGDAVTSVTITYAGSGYTSAPTITFTGGGGTGATATAVLSTAWVYATQFDYIPVTTTYAANNSSQLDEMHIIVIDEDGAITGKAGTVLEKFAGVSKASDAKDDTNQSNYYKDVINTRSKWIRWMDHPTNGTNWGSASSGAITFISLVPGDGDQEVSMAGGADSSPVDGDLQSGYALFANDELVDVNLIMAGGHSATVGDYIIDNVAEIRKDCMVFISPQKASVVNNAGSEATTSIAELASYTRSSYAVMDSGWKYMYDKYNDKYRWIPCNGDVAGACVTADLVADPWFSPAGYNRGAIKNAVKLAYSPNKTDRDALYKAGINPIVGFPGNGIVLFGDKTMLAKASAFNRINVRRLFITVEKAISTAAKFQLFELNDQYTRAQFRSLVIPFLRNVQGRRGVYDFRVVCDETNNTPEVIDQNQFRADIYLKPAKSINFITLTFVATRTGISFEELGA